MMQEDFDAITLMSVQGGSYVGGMLIKITVSVCVCVCVTEREQQSFLLTAQECKYPPLTII